MSPGLKMRHEDRGVEQLTGGTSLVATLAGDMIPVLQFARPDIIKLLILLIDFLYFTGIGGNVHLEHELRKR